MNNEAPKIPEPGGSYRPPKDRQRQIVIAMRDDFRDKGFQAEMNAKAVRVQSPDEDGQTIEQREEQWLATAANCYASAHEMDKELEALPAPRGLNSTTKGSHLKVVTDAGPAPAKV